MHPENGPNIRPPPSKEDNTTALLGRFPKQFRNELLVLVSSCDMSSKTAAKKRVHRIGQRIQKKEREMNAVLKRGDMVLASGVPATTGTGELSIIPQHLRLMSPCFHQLPNCGLSERLADNELRYRNRHVDFMVNIEAVRREFRVRAQIIRKM